MATFTLRKLDDDIAEQFKQMAKDHGRSAEAELRSVVEEVTRRYVERKAQPQETGADWFIQAHDIWMNGLDENDKDAPFVLPERDATSRDPFQGWNEEDWRHIEGRD